ncbi:patatin family protein [Corynebacterium mendelii]|uniref:Patatin-like phospholipase family protein n=1 Tax=Corynebacterium mendelii TaxID=2765362 RepID=A0A939E3C8_9CORY|nr:patatin-like phospholipase family protein [Corynebacterium mendelii]MBN9644817.1 patatin-like phospholipase family protein [Corynebacterium mendelii]
MNHSFRPSSLHAGSVALVIEGGGMRCAHTAALIDKLVGEHVSFGWVGGISAGAAQAVNFLTGDRERIRSCFLDFASDRKGAGWWPFLQGRGYFDAEYIYETAPLSGNYSYDFDAFFTNPTPVKIGATRADTAQPVWWGREEITSARDLTTRVRASSTMPGLMPETVIDGLAYFDGALGPDAGIAVDAARADGFTRFLVVCSQPRDYIKSPLKNSWMIKQVLRNYPLAAEAFIDWPKRYNRVRRSLIPLERTGHAYVYYPDEMPITNTELNLTKLKHSFDSGVEQSDREWPLIRDFLEKNATV